MNGNEWTAPDGQNNGTGVPNYDNDGYAVNGSDTYEQNTMSGYAPEESNNYQDGAQYAGQKIYDGNGYIPQAGEESAADSDEAETEYDGDFYVDLESFFNACTGRGDDGMAKSMTTASIIAYSGNEGDEENLYNYREVSTRYTKQGSVVIEPHGDFIQVDLVFKTGFDPEMRAMWSLLTEYGKLKTETEMIFANGGIPDEQQFLIFYVLPDEYLTECYLTFTNPVFWAMQPEEPGDERANVIRMAVLPEQFSINPVTEDIDSTKAIAQQQRWNMNVPVENPRR